MHRQRRAAVRHATDTAPANRTASAHQFVDDGIRLASEGDFDNALVRFDMALNVASRGAPVIIRNSGTVSTVDTSATFTPQQKDRLLFHRGRAYLHVAGGNWREARGQFDKMSTGLDDALLKLAAEYPGDSALYDQLKARG